MMKAVHSLYCTSQCKAKNRSHINSYITGFDKSSPRIHRRYAATTSSIDNKSLFVIELFVSFGIQSNPLRIPNTMAFSLALGEAWDELRILLYNYYFTIYVVIAVFRIDFLHRNGFIFSSFW